MELSRRETVRFFMGRVGEWRKSREVLHGEGGRVEEEREGWSRQGGKR